MAGMDDLQKAIADVKQSAADEATRVEKVITDLRDAATKPTGISAADVEAAAVELEAVAANLNAIEAPPAPATPATT